MKFLPFLILAALLVAQPVVAGMAALWTGEMAFPSGTALSPFGSNQQAVSPVPASIANAKGK